MRTLFVLVLMLMLGFNLFGQSSSICKMLDAQKIQLDDSNALVISNKPVTNIEYLRYMFWSKEVFIDYPEVFVSVFPYMDNKTWDSIHYFEYHFMGSDMEGIFKYAPPIITQYLFNPKYADSPVLGINLAQAIKYNKWYRDRINEKILSKEKLIDLKKGQQLNEEHFVTESFLNGQFSFVSQRFDYDNLLKYVDSTSLLVKTIFRLPTKDELELIKPKKNSAKFSKNKPPMNVLFDFKEFRFDSIAYTFTLYPYSKNKDSIQIKPKLFIITNPIAELFLDMNCSPTTNQVKLGFESLGYFIKPSPFFHDNYGEFHLKDSIGQMRFNYLTVKAKKEPQYLTSYIHNNFTTAIKDLYDYPLDTLYTFRFCYIEKLNN